MSSLHIAFFSGTETIALLDSTAEKLEALILDKDCIRYLSPVGAKEYLIEDGVLPNSSINLAFQEYIPQPYTQYNSQEFVSHLSIFDVIANLGMHETSEYVLNGIETSIKI